MPSIKSINNYKYSSNSTSNSKVSFKGGLTPKTMLKWGLNSAPDIADKFKAMGVDANFGFNRAIACCVAQVNDIFEALCKNYGLPFDAKPPCIRIYTRKTVRDSRLMDAWGLCLSDSDKVLKHQPAFQPRSLFLNGEYNNLAKINNLVEKEYNEVWLSTRHFLGPYIHEWAHNVHFDLLFKKFGYDGRCKKTRAIYNMRNGKPHDPNPKVKGYKRVCYEMFPRTYSKEEREKIRVEISQYAAGSFDRIGRKSGGNPLEVVAEYLTKRIAGTLDEETMLPTRNPFENINECETVVNIFQKAWDGIL